jgi:hypothetical protein
MNYYTHTYTMDKKLQRIKIAEACGWSNVGIDQKIGDITCRRDAGDLWGLPPGYHIGEYSPWAYRVPPDYLDDLNAMHEAEKVLKGEKWVEYVRMLAGMNETYKGLCHATAAQRAEAFLRTLNLWDDQ